ncbi:MAG: ArsA-related P-loop ATPase [Nannocystaceae bacterium]
MRSTPSDSTAEVLEQLARRQLLVVSGKGGVGRTTVAALLGLALARCGRRVLVATTGHDDRLAWLLGGDTLADSPRQVSERLWIQRLEPRRCVREFGALMTHSRRLSNLVLDNTVVRNLIRAIPGLDDFAVLGKAWHEAVRGHAFDSVVFDGAASGHLRFNLGVAKAVYDTVPNGPLKKEAAAVDRSLRDGSKVVSVLVGLPELWPLTEMGALAQSLRDEVGVAVGALVVNGMLHIPEALPDLANVTPARLSDAVHTSAVDAVATVAQRADRQQQELQRWLASPAAMACHAIPRLLVPWHAGGFSTADDLTGLLSRTREF